MNHIDPIVKLQNVHVRLDAQLVLSDINWELRPGENWAVLGANGAGKTTFLRLVRGDIWPTPGKGTRTYCTNGVPSFSPIVFRTETGIVSSDLLDQYRRMGWNITGREVILSGFWGTAYVHQEPDNVQLERADAIVDILGLGRLVQRRILTLSQGEAKRILIARALVHNPRLLILDEVCESLDQAAKACVLDTIQKAAEKGTQILYATHMTDDLLPTVTNVLKLDLGRIADQGAKKESGLDASEPIVRPLHRVEKTTRVDEKQGNSQDFLICVKNTDVWLGGKRILSDLDWTIRRGENWAILGENGSGKTTLLKLLIGEINPRLGGSIHRFGDAGPKTVWEIRRRISLVSADLQAIHMDGQTGLETVLSGFFGSIGLHDTPTQSQLDTARDWMAFLGIESLESRDIRTLSYGQFRMLLIARAVVTGPDILLLDEPTAGLDVSATKKVLVLVEKLAARGTRIVYVTHRPELMLACMTNVAVMREGRLTVQG